jgi:hypothetical protein
LLHARHPPGQPAYERRRDHGGCHRCTEQREDLRCPLDDHHAEERRDHEEPKKMKPRTDTTTE